MDAPALTNEQIVGALQELVGEQQVLHRPIDILARAGDASIYRLVPRVVVLPRHLDDVRAILRYCRENGLYLTFRAAGTSLSGQAVTDGILVDVAKHWKGLRILDGGKQVAVQPGVVGGHVNAFLASHRAKIGPDPASINACMIGGIAANNASGMCCGVAQNSYNTMASMKLTLADGFTVDTADPEANDLLRAERPDIVAGLMRIRDEIRSDAALSERIRRKYAIKNTCGYSMNAFVDFERPIDILSHLLIGSEGTLGFISEITLNSIPDKPLKSTALVFFADLIDAGTAIDPLGKAGAAVLEIMDRSAMFLVTGDLRYNFEIIGNCAALLVEFQEDDEEALRRRLVEAGEILSRYRLLEPVQFTRDPVLQARFWQLRKGLFPSVGAMREIGTAVIIEDVCVHPARLAECIFDLQELFAKHKFQEAIIFGHAKDGNLHFVISTDFAREEHSRRYAGLIDELMAMIVEKYDGSLKAEHGTGRNVAPFVESEWGTKLYGLMWDVKALLDPDNVLNPGVVLNRDPGIHMKHLKVMPPVSSVVDKCIECGFCEPRCPSRDLTLTPRQRIALAREIVRLRAPGSAQNLAMAAGLKEGYRYHGDATCAGDGMCATSCPVKIDTGAMIKNLRAENHSRVAHERAVVAARNFETLARGARMGLMALKMTGPAGKLVARLSSEIMNRLTGGVAPRLPRGMPIPDPAPALPQTHLRNDGRPRVVYYPSCLTRTMGKLPGERAPVGLAQAVVAVLEKCGFDVIIPAGIEKTCCGQPFYSKGYFDGARESAASAASLLWEASCHGEIPIVCETSPCSGQMLLWEKSLQGDVREKARALKVWDFPSFMARNVIPQRTDWPRLDREVILHPTCTLIKLGGLDDLKAVASTFARTATVPVLAECCGFAGDRGFNYPELTLSATKPEAGEVKTLHGNKADCYSTCRTCEIGMTAATKRVYQSIVYLCYDALISKPGS